MERGAGKIGMITRRTTQLGLRCQGVQRGERPILPLICQLSEGTTALRAVCFVRLLARGIDHSRRRLSRIPSRKVAVSPAWDLFRGFLTHE